MDHNVLYKCAKYYNYVIKTVASKAFTVNPPYTGQYTISVKSLHTI